MTLQPLNTASRLKLATATILQSPFVARPLSVVSRHRIRSFDLTFDTSHELITPKVEAQLFWRLYESSEIRMVRKHLRGCNVIVDLGSSLGFTASHALSRMAPAGHFIAVEANRQLIASLTYTLNSHAEGRTVEIENIAIARPEDKEVRLALSGENVASRVASTGDTVPATTLFEIVAKHGLERFALISDIEGSEASVIFDDLALDRCDRMVIELHDTTYGGHPISVGELVDGLVARGFAILEQQGPVFALARTP